MMDREFTPREQGMLLVLALLLLTLGYMKLFYAPVQQAVTELCRAAVLETVCVYGVDLLDLERAARHQDPAFFAAHQEEWSAVIAQAGFRCEVRVE